MRLRASLPFILLTALPGLLFAQELNCTVAVNADQIQTSDRGVFRDMEIAFERFLNSRKWTNDEYDNHERINCNLVITINRMPAIGSFSATVQVQSARPIYNSNYESILLNFADRDWEFEYVESLPLDFSDNNYISNLTSMLAFYAYIILGVDYDSFSELGGTEYFQKALNVLNNAQQSNRPGWESLGSTRNRYWLVENFTNQQMVSIRKGYYNYHRMGLDKFTEDPENTRQQIASVLSDIQDVRNTFPNSILVISFLDAKAAELVNIYSEGSIQLRREVYEILTTLDPSKQDQYQKILN